jgi:hypothetical protein
MGGDLGDRLAYFLHGIQTGQMKLLFLPVESMGVARSTRHHKLNYTLHVRFQFYQRNWNYRSY